MQEDIKKELEKGFGAKATIQANTVKATVPEINGEGIVELFGITVRDGVKDVKLKRSGTSITILVEV